MIISCKIIRYHLNGCNDQSQKQYRGRFNIATGVHEIFLYDATFHFVAELVAITD